ncbi:MAG: hypothetical protein Q4A41_06160 [Bacillota bacterium]|nr:hypothetical protein [Bacillota bacterium]
MNILAFIGLGLLVVAMLLDKFLKNRLPSWVSNVLFAVAIILFVIVIVYRRMNGG